MKEKRKRALFPVFLFLSILLVPVCSHAQVGPVILGPDGKPAPALVPAPVPISLDEAIQLLFVNNNEIKLAGKSVEIARAEKQKLNSLWFPYVRATGTYMHFSNDIEAKGDVGDVMKPLENTVKKYLPTQEQINGFFQDAMPVIQQLFPHLNQQQIAQLVSGVSGVVSGISSSVSSMVSELNGITLSFPILKQNISTIDANITWPLFTGGKRIYANRIGKSMVAAAEGLKSATTDAQLAVLIETYYTLKLSREVINERQESVTSMTLLFNNAMSLMRNGMINKAEMLVAQVAMEEAIRELENARDNASVAENALKTLLGIPRTGQPGPLHPTTGFFIQTTLPPIEHYHEQIENNNPQLRILEEQKNISKNEKKIAESAYMPNIALFAKQTLYTYQIPSNLSPRTVLGAGLVWNIFDGLNREKNISISKKNYQQIEIKTEQARNDLFLLADKLRAQMMDALYNIRALQSTTELCEELLTIREKSFKEGMANSTDVVTARATLSKARLARLLAYWQFDIAFANMNALCGISRLPSEDDNSKYFPTFQHISN